MYAGRFSGDVSAVKLTKNKVFIAYNSTGYKSGVDYSDGLLYGVVCIINEDGTIRIR